MIDIHCHLLPGMDDGAADFETTEELLSAAAQDGISTIICTPHFSPAGQAALDTALETLQPRAAAAGIRLLAGMEYQYNRLAFNSRLRPLGNSRFLLVDLGCRQLPPSVCNLFFELSRRNFQIIIAHPERYLESLESCRILARYGAYFQLNADSITGRNGKRCRRRAESLMAAGYCHYVASDAHGGRRTFHFSECRERLNSMFGTGFSERVLKNNPERLLNNLPPEPPLTDDFSLQRHKAHWLTALFFPRWR